MTDGCELESVDILATSILLWLSNMAQENRLELWYLQAQMRWRMCLGTAVNEAPSASTSHSEWDLTWVWVSLNTPPPPPYVLKGSKKETAYPGM